MSSTAAPFGSPQLRSQGIALRRGLVLIGMSLILPGSAQLAAGNHRLGRWATRIWLGLIAVLIVVVLLSFGFRGLVLGWLTNPIVLTSLRWLVLALALGWVALLLDAWRLADPRAMSRVGMIVSGLLALSLSVAGGGLAWSASGILAAQSKFVSTIFAGGGSSEVHNGRINVLLLGGDAGANREGLRPDSMTVASIDAQTGRTVLFSLPRNLQHAPFPTSSPLYSKYPNGYYCKVTNLSNACMLNGIYTLAVNNKKLFKGVKYPGVVATQSVIEEILGLKINYWAMVDMKGFRELIDAVGGIRLDIGKDVPMGSSHGRGGVFGVIKAGTNVHLDGFHALWFARSREGSTDYERMARQKCVMNAMLKQLNPTTVLTRFQAIAEAGEQVVATNVPSSDLGTLLDLAMKGKSLTMTSVSFTPPLITPANPDFDKIRSVTAAAITASEAVDNGGTTATSAASSTSSTASGTSTKKSTSKSSSKSSAGASLDAICKVSS